MKLNLEREFQGPTYRFILYGRARAGKTCYLAALAMARKMNPKGYTCDWLNATKHCPKPLGDPSNWDWHDPIVARYKGMDWLTQASEALENGGTPPSNPNEEAPFRYLFEFRGPVDVPGVPGFKRTYRVEFIDYSGELIDPKVSEMQLAGLVRKHLDEADGILVLAEAPRDDNDRTLMFKEQQKLCAAFDLIKIPERGIPIALVFNKWDRLGEDFDPRKVDPENPLQNTPDKREEFVIEKFLSGEPEPAHRRLRSALGDKCGDDNFRMFTASALGPCEPFVDQNGKPGERPKAINPLNSYGLENPFIWMANRSDQLRFAALEKAAAKLKTWALWQFPVGAINLEKQADTVAPYVEKVVLWKIGVDGLRSKGRMAALRQGSLIFLIAAAAIIASLMTYNTGADQAKFSQIELFVSTPSNFAEIAEVASVGLTSTGELSHDKKETAELSNKKKYTSLADYIAELRGYDTWLAELTQGAALRSGTLALMPKERLAEVREKLNAQLNDAKALAQNTEAIAAFGNRFADIEKSILSAKSKRDMKPIDERIEALEHDPSFEPYRNKLQLRLSVLQRQLNTKKLDFDDSEVAVALRKSYNALLAENNLAAAATLLEGADTGDATKVVTQELREDLKAKAEELLMNLVRNEVAQRRYTQAAALLTTTLNPPAVEKLLGTSAVAALKDKENAWIWKPQDRELYEKVRYSRDESTCEEYLNSSRLHEMRSVVSEYRDFLARAKKTSDYKLSVEEIRCGGKSWWYPSTFKYTTKAIVYNGSSKVLETGFSGSTIDANATVTPGYPSSGTLSNKAREELVSIVVEVRVDSDRNNGGMVSRSETKAYSIPRLAAGVVIPLQDVDDESGHSVKIKLTGYEEAPSLPDYGGR